MRILQSNSNQKTKERIFESILREELHKQFTRAGGKFTVPLNNLAAEEKAGGWMDYDFVTDQYESDAPAEWPDRQWYEVVDIDGTALRCIPVDKFGNKLTKAQIGKLNPKWAEWLEKKGYCKNIYFDAPVLHVSTKEGERKNSRMVDDNDDGKYFSDYDENGNVIPDDNYLARLAKEGKEYDPDFDDISGYNTRRKRYARYGDFNTRQEYRSAAQRKADAEEKARQRRAKYKDKNYYSPFFSGANSIMNDFWKDQPVKLEGADLDEFVQGLRYFTSSYRRPEDFDKREFKKWCISKGLDWDGVRELAHQMTRAFGEAYNASIGLY